MFKDGESRIKTMIQGALVIAKKDMKIYYLKPPVLIFGVLFPMFLFLSFAVGRNVPLDTLVPGMVGITLFFTASSVVPLILPWETRLKTLELLISAPIGVNTILLGDILASFFFGIIISLLPLTLGLFVFGATLVYFPILVLNIILSSFCFSCLGNIISFPPTSEPSQIMMFSNLIRLPLIFISGIFIPVSEMPAWGRIIAPLSPLTYTTELTRFALGGQTSYSPYISFVMIALFSVVFLVVGFALHKKSMPKRVQNL